MGKGDFRQRGRAGTWLEWSERGGADPIKPCRLWRELGFCSASGGKPREHLSTLRFVLRKLPLAACGAPIVQEVAEDAGRMAGRRLESDSQRLMGGDRAGQCRAGGQPWAVLCRQDLWMKGKWSVKKRGGSDMTPASPLSRQANGGDRH